MALRLGTFILATLVAGCSGSNSGDPPVDIPGQDVITDVQGEVFTDATGEPGPDTVGTDLNVADPGQVDPGTKDPGQTDPGQNDPGQMDPGQMDPGTQDPGQVPDTDTGGDKGGCVTEICDGIDNDCDDEVDEGFDDTDQDTIADCVDPDIDGDGLLNEVDSCPYVASADRVDTDQDGQGDECDCDIDNDGIYNVNPGCDDPDPEDNCTYVVNPDQTDTCQNGVGDACDDDNDCDGVPASSDNCPILFNPKQENFDNDDMGDLCDEDDDNDLDPDDTDCAPFDADIHKDAMEVCNGVDDNCDGTTDECPPGQACDVNDDCAKLPVDIEFRLPAEPGSLAPDWVVHVDHDPVIHGGVGSGPTCLAFDGNEDFPNCYDEHKGTDFMIAGFDLLEVGDLFPSAFAAMDAGEEVLAAADGEVVSLLDGNYDRCHLDFATWSVSCDGYPMVSNSVTLLHEGGYKTAYHHLRKDSIVVTVGQQVDCGDKIGLIGSSGYSTAPHIHFQITGPMGEVIDPFAGVESQPESYWVDQSWDTLLPAPLCEGE